MHLDASKSIVKNDRTPTPPPFSKSSLNLAAVRALFYDMNIMVLKLQIVRKVCEGLL